MLKKFALLNIFVETILESIYLKYKFFTVTFINVLLLLFNFFFFTEALLIRKIHLNSIKKVKTFNAIDYIPFPNVHLSLIWHLKITTLSKYMIYEFNCN